MDKQNKQVREFHETFNIPIRDIPGLPAEERSELRIKLLIEEVEELVAAIKGDDLIEAADAIIDCMYILHGTALEFGLGDKMEEMFDEVHRSNMSKVDATGKAIVREDGKILKSEFFSPPNLKDIIYDR